MRTARLTTIIAMISFLIAGSLYSSVCNLNCAFYECAQTVAAKPVQENAPPSHCHRHADSQSSAAHTPAPRPAAPRDDSRNCPAHDDAMMLPAGASVTVAITQPWQPLGAALPVAASFSLDDRLDHAVARAPLRSPPSRAVILPLRI
jgi:hypothetical protein